MSNEKGVTPVPKAMFWTGCVISALPVLMLLMSAYFKFAMSEEVVTGFKKMSYEQNTIIPIAVAELASTILYVIPQTSVLGAILLTGYLGGATATHVAAEEAWFGPVVFGILIWLGLLLRDRRLWELLPLRR